MKKNALRVKLWQNWKVNLFKTSKNYVKKNKPNTVIDENLSFSEEIGKKEEQKLKTLHQHKRSEWAGLGTFGMVGWSVAVPTILGCMLGLWLDKNHPKSFSWTLSLMIAGLMLGCLIAWQWVAKENEMMHQDKEEEDE
ncbi:MAG: AtpZ/AtpI family protein [Cyclobacteriaceae bacterium]|nr:AtpZ/AtpI family protein [Cyclobacteriaceae bacterium]